MTTIGDRVLNISLPKIGEKSLFTRDLEDALRNGGVDFVVHSLKDLPTVLPTGMAIGAVLEREDARDALVLREEYKEHTLKTLPKGSIIGTSSLRRTSQIRRFYPQLTVCDIRGNLNTRLAKLDAKDSKFTGIILAQAGLIRMGWTKRITQVLEPTDLLYAVGQGALAVECRANDTDILTMLRTLMCVSTMCRILAERSFLKTLGGGCSAPVAVYSKLHSNISDNKSKDEAELFLTGAVWSLDGTIEIRHKMKCSLVLEAQNHASLLQSVHDDHAHEIPLKRSRNTNSSDSNDQKQNLTIINDDSTVEYLSSSYNMKQLLDKHVDLAKKCPIVSGFGLQASSCHSCNRNVHIGGGDANIIAKQCPLQMDVGQDFMGQCPFVNNDIKVSMVNIEKCPFITEANIQIQCTEDTNHTSASTSDFSISPLHQIDGHVKKDVPTKDIHGKCPFLKQAVPMFEYTDEETSHSNKFPILLDDVDNLFCGIYLHTCFSKELFLRSDKLGQQLAEALIQKGALDVMKCAQAEVHKQ